jgi:hypothetical protein
MHLKLTNGENPQHYSFVQLLADNPELGNLATMPPDVDLVTYEVYPYTMDPFPAYSEINQTVELGAFRQESGSWVRGWNVVALPDEDAARNARAVRDAEIATSDWTQVLDAPVDRAVWAAYRQALRDIPQQVGFPHDIVWPVAPQ